MVSIKEEDNDDNHNHKQEEPHNQQEQQQEQEGKPQMESESSPLHPHLPPKRQQQKAPSRIPPALPPRSHLPQKPVPPQDEKPQMESHSQSSLLQSHLPPKPQVESHSKSSLLQSLLPPKPQMESQSQPHSSILHSHLPPKPHMSESSLAQSHLPQKLLPQRQQYLEEKPQIESQSQPQPHSSILHSHLPPKPHMSELSLAQSHLPPKLLPQRHQYLEEKPQIESQSSHLRSHLPTQLITQIEPAPHHENLSQIIAKDRQIHGFSPLHSPSQEDSFNNKKSIQLHQPLHSPSQDDSFNNKKSIQLHQHNLEPIQPNPVSPVIVVNRSIREELAVVSKMDHGVNNDFPHAGGVGGGGGGGKRSVVNDGGDRRSKTVSSILRKEQREAMVNRAALGFRVCAAVFCLISFSVMAADKTQGWAGDSFDRHKEYRYCLAVGVIGFVYAGFQAFNLAYYLIASRHVIQSHLRCYFEFSMDQILTYLLISASSAAASRVDDWQSNWGKDEFTVMASASVGMSFLAFIAFAFSSLISGYNLCTQ